MADKTAAFDRETKCGGCLKDLDMNKSGSLTCSVCDLWLHKACTGLNTANFNAMVKMQGDLGYHGWACKPCGTATQSLSKNLKVLESRMITIEGQFKDVQSQVTSLDAKVQNLAQNDDQIKEVVSQISSLDAKVQDMAQNGNVSNSQSS